MDGTRGETGPDESTVSNAASLQERRHLTLKNGDAFGVFDRNGDIYPGADAVDGLYWRDTRYLSRLELSLGGAAPTLLSATLRDDNATLTSDLSNAELPESDGKPEVPAGAMHLQRSRFLWQGACYERLTVRNFGQRPAALSLELAFAADFADLFEVRGMHRDRHGEHLPAEHAAGQVTLAYLGLDRKRRATTLRFDPAPERIEDGAAQFDLDVPPGGRCAIYVEIGFDRAPAAQPPRETFVRAMLDARRALRLSSSRAAAIASSNELFNEGIRRAISDLYMLVTETPDGPYPYAGVPWFSAAFGRDALITALQTLWLDPALARGVLVYLARNQATETDAAADAEPGKILHEVRHGEMAELGEVPFRRYYGSVDSTPLFLMLAGAYLDRTGDLETLRTLWPHLEAALGWIDQSGDRDGDGFVEYARRTGEGLANQGWKDSFDSIFHADGTLAKGPIALCEVQGYVFAARRAVAQIARALELFDVATAQEAAAERLRVAFEDAFWCEDIGTYAIALDGEKRPCRVRASNAGQVLLSGIAAPARAARVAEALMGEAFFSGWGIRTLAAGEARYNPMSYHDGSVWPHDNALIGIGLARYGRHADVARLLEALFDASLYIELRRLPELYCGFPRRRAQGPVFYPVACSPQAWAATAIPALLQASLGLRFDPRTRTVHFEQPRLPAFLDEVTLYHLAVGGARVTVLLRRAGEEVTVAVRERHGDVRVTVTS